MAFPFLAAMPFIQKALPFLPGVSSVLSKAAGGRAEGRQNEAYNLLRQQQLKLMQGQFDRDSPNIRAGQAVRGDVMTNVQDFKTQLPPHLQRFAMPSTGGLRPSEVLGPASRGAGAALAQLGQRKLGNEGVGPVPDLPQGNALDKMLGYGGLATGLLGSLGGQPPTQGTGQPGLSSPGALQPDFGVNQLQGDFEQLLQQQQPAVGGFVDPTQQPFGGQRKNPYGVNF